ncbi:glutelin type-D 1-like [Mercurialis annua]|uniref:glutelin type-D 1-like n=1 Tax=Mercurialis annua TaxID=3986 RepID=UPI0021603ADB|nr:glutelin type-D 1-like [Mercurialis annua]
MEVDLSPKFAKKTNGGNGGYFSTWSPSELPMLGKGNIAAVKLSLLNNGFVLPHYADSSKVGYVLQGSGVAGIILPESEEKVIAIKKGDALALPFGTVIWFYNKEDTELEVIFLGDTSKAHKSGEITAFNLAGTNAIFTGFSSEFLARAFDLDEDFVTALIQNQPGHEIIKLEENFKLPEPNNEHRRGIALSCDEVPLYVDVKNGGRLVVLNTKNFPILGEIGLGADLVTLEGNAMFSPGFSCDSALRVTYIVRGSGRVQVVGADGRKVLETDLNAGCLFIVPRFFIVSKIANPEGMEWLSVITTPDPVFSHLAGRTSVLMALSPQVLQASFNVDSDVIRRIRFGTSDAIFFPSRN